MRLRNAQCISRADITAFPIDDFRSHIVKAVNQGARIAAFFCHDGLLIAVLARDEEGILETISSRANAAYASITPDCPQAHWFEREIYEQSGVKPEGHPNLNPIRSGQSEFFRVDGEEVHEVAVGPVHAGIIEPGHFRFQCHGENVLHLEIALGYQHRGVEAALVGGPDKRAIHLMETLAGDTTIGHATAYAQIIEALSPARLSARAMVVRGIALELERLANHTGDLGALANDVGYLPTGAYCGRVRGDFLNMTALICGSRFGRGLVRPGGAGFDIDASLVDELSDRLDLAFRDLAGAADLLWNSASVMARFENVGTLSLETALKLGIVGPAARACGIERDVRHDFANGVFGFSQIPISTAPSGDAFARAFVRWLEIQRSAAFIREQLEHLPIGSIGSQVHALAPDSFCVSLVEGWRGEICHAALTDSSGRFAQYKIIDPSFHNWFALAMAMRNQQISDFPLCNKSFNLSYCGHDL
ncbi:MAG: NADH-quinone oxidoreductase subunit C [Elusimicrobia bacterium]|nr:NADH-quinone oxidoreductase subunit C [Elusimicrobiota bacterium]